MASNANERDIARPRFYRDAVHNKAKSDKEGRPIFDEKDMVEIILPGDKLLTWVGEVDESHKRRWPDHWAAYKRGEARAATGTPIEHWPNPVMTTGRVAELKALDILSVEELAGLPDSILPKLGMGARDLREAAQAYIATAKDSAMTNAMASRIAQLEETVKRFSGAHFENPTTMQATTPAPEKPIEQCSDDELKQFIKKKTGKAPAGRIGRDTLLKRVAELATAA